MMIGQGTLQALVLNFDYQPHSYFPLVFMAKAERNQGSFCVELV
jgi:hypothetical protein